MTTAAQHLTSTPLAFDPEVCEANHILASDSDLPIDQLQAAEDRIHSFHYSLSKRVYDIVCSSTLIILLAPICLAIALCILFTSPGPILYTEKRIGRYGRAFTILKFRSMHTKEYLRSKMKVHMEDEHLFHLRTFAKSHGDFRTTPIGAILRKWSLDELPQLFNVLRGDMSLVGPRPVVAKEREMYGSLGVFYDMTIPGISGLWQVSGRSDITFNERVILDCAYATNWSIFLDIAILAKTLPAVLQKKGAY
jgi:lipopolysaccharide/colanic/teichoic acid biosynthesis glycosyltransferase